MGQKLFSSIEKVHSEILWEHQQGIAAEIVPCLDMLPVELLSDVLSHCHIEETCAARELCVKFQEGIDYWHAQELCELALHVTKHFTDRGSRAKTTEERKRTEEKKMMMGENKKEPSKKTSKDYISSVNHASSPPPVFVPLMNKYSGLSLGRNSLGKEACYLQSPYQFCRDVLICQASPCLSSLTYLEEQKYLLAGRPNKEVFIRFLEVTQAGPYLLRILLLFAAQNAKGMIIPSWTHCPLGVYLFRKEIFEKLQEEIVDAPFLHPIRGIEEFHLFSASSSSSFSGKIPIYRRTDGNILAFLHYVKAVQKAVQPPVSEEGEEEENEKENFEGKMKPFSFSSFVPLRRLTIHVGLLPDTIASIGKICGRELECVELHGVPSLSSVHQLVLSCTRLQRLDICLNDHASFSHDWIKKIAKDAPQLLFLQIRGAVNQETQISAEDYGFILKSCPRLEFVRIGWYLCQLTKPLLEQFLMCNWHNDDDGDDRLISATTQNNETQHETSNYNCNNQVEFDGKVQDSQIIKKEEIPPKNDSCAAATTTTTLISAKNGTIAKSGGRCNTKLRSLTIGPVGTNIAADEITDEVFMKLLNSPCCSSLEEISLQLTPPRHHTPGTYTTPLFLTSASLDHIASSLCSQTLQMLDLSKNAPQCELKDATMVNLLKNCTQLRYLDLSGNKQLSGAVLACLISTPCRELLEYLNINDTNIDFKDCASALRSNASGDGAKEHSYGSPSLFLKNLQCLHFRSIDMESSIDEADVISILGHCPRLEYVSLNASCGESTLYCLAQCCPKLKYLDASFFRGRGSFTDASVIEIAKNCAQLMYLDLSGSGDTVTEESLCELSQGCPQLRDIVGYRRKNKDQAKLALSRCLNLSVKSIGF